MLNNDTDKKFSDLILLVESSNKKLERQFNRELIILKKRNRTLEVDVSILTKKINELITSESVQPIPANPLKSNPQVGKPKKVKKCPK